VTISFREIQVLL